MNRSDWVPNGNSFVCSVHFVSGWQSYEAWGADYAPSVFSYKETAIDEKLQERAFRRDLSKLLQRPTRKGKTACCICQVRCTHTVKMAKVMLTKMSRQVPWSTMVILPSLSQKIKCDTDPLIEENQQLREENERLWKELKMMKWGVNKIKDNDKATRFHSGLPTFAVFMWLYR